MGLYTRSGSRDRSDPDVAIKAYGFEACMPYAARGCIIIMDYVPTRRVPDGRGQFSAFQ